MNAQMSSGHTCSAIVLSYPQFVETLGISNGKPVIVGIYRLLAVFHVNAELVTTLSCNLLNAVQPCMEKWTKKKKVLRNTPRTLSSIYPISVFQPINM